MHIEEENFIQISLDTAFNLFYLPKNDEDFPTNPAGMVGIWYLAFLQLSHLSIYPGVYVLVMVTCSAPGV